MSHDAFEDRRLALEEQFFIKQSAELTKRIKDARTHAVTKDTVRRMSGINNEHVLECLADMNVGGAALLVLSLYPLVEVAWADGTVDEKERKVVLDQATAAGLGPQTEGGQFISHWLIEKPEMQWHALWAEYTMALVSKMTADAKEKLKHEVLGRARHVAEASGGFLGLGWRVSSAEQAVLDKLAKAF